MSIIECPLLAVYQKKKPTRKPVWFMRQAGRYLPEYRELRKQHTMLEAIQTAEVAAEITLQPLRRFDLDAAIIFADILNPLIGMGIELDFIEKEGPKIFNPIVTPADVAKLIVPEPRQSVASTLEAIRIVRKALEPQSKPVLGFAGSPFTLSTYVIEGKTAHSLTHVKNFAAKYPEAWTSLQDTLKKFVVSYLVAQVEAGVSGVQLFDSWAGMVSPYFYQEYILPTVQSLVNEFKALCPETPLTYFSTGTSGFLHLIKQIPADGFSVDWRSPLSTTSQLLGKDIPLQGNLDPELMAGEKSQLEKEVRSILEDSRSVPHHIFNLGHGILPHTPIENVEMVLKLVRSYENR